MRQGWVCVLLAVLGVGCAAPRAGRLATVNGEAVTGEDLKAEFSRRHAALEKYMGGDEKVVRDYLGSVIDRRLFLQEAARLGFNEEPEVVEAVRELEGRKVEDRLLELEVKDRITVTDEEIAAAQAKLDVVYDVREIVTWTKEEIDAVAAELARGADFELLARTRSRVGSAKHGGRLPPFVWGREDEVSEPVLMALKPGETSAPFTVAGAWRILRLDRTAPPEKKPEEAKARVWVSEVLKRRKAAALERALDAGLRTKYGASLVPCECDLDVLTAASKEPARAGEPVVATWRGGALTRRQFARQLKLDRITELAPERRPGQIGILLERFVDRRLVREEGLARGLAAEPAIAAAVARFRDDQLESRLFGGYVYRGLTVSDEDVAARFERDADRYVIPEKRRVSQVIVKDLEAANVVRTRLVDGASLSDLTDELEATQGKQRGERTGWLTARDLPEGFSQVFAVGRGEYTQPIRSENGYHVVKVLDISPGRRLRLEEVKKQLKEEMLEDLRRTRTEEWAVKLRKAADIRIDDRGIREYLQANPARPEEAPKAPAAMHPGGAGGGEAPVAPPATPSAPPPERSGSAAHTAAGAPAP